MSKFEELPLIEKIKLKIKQSKDAKTLTKFSKWVNETRDKIPSDFNQIHLLDYLFDKKIDRYFSLSTRTDGKTFNYFHAFMKFNITFNEVGVIISSHYSARNQMYYTLRQIADFFDDLKENLIDMVRFDDYLEIYYDDELIFFITDVENASDLKNSSSIVSRASYIVYDEFIRVDNNYLPYEYEAMRTIYGTIDRNNEQSILPCVKEFYFGNTENFNSPIFAGNDMYEILDSHKIDTLQVYGNLCLEWYVNINQNKKRNVRAYPNDTVQTFAQFESNKYKTVSKSEITDIHRYFAIKIEAERFIKVYYNHNHKEFIIEVTNNVEHFEFTTQLTYLTSEKVIYLSERFYKENFKKQYQLFQNIHFLNYFSLAYFDDNSDYTSLNLFKCVALLSKDKEKISKSQIEINVEKTNKENRDKIYLHFLEKKTTKRLT